MKPFHTFTMSSGAQAGHLAQFSLAQKWLDNEVLKDCDKFVPFRRGDLVKSGILGSRIGSGMLQYIQPYSSKCYYGTHINFNPTTHPLACAKWFEKAKALEKDKWQKGVKTIAGGV